MEKKDEITYVNFTKLSSEELRMVYEWRTSERVRKYMDNSNTFSYEEHLKFCESLKNRQDKLYFLVKVNDEPCAVMDFVNISKTEGSAECGFYVQEPYTKYGAAISRCTWRILKALGIAKVKAHVHKDNEKAVLYNLLKTRATIVGEDEISYHMETKVAQADDDFCAQYQVKIVW